MPRDFLRDSNGDLAVSNGNFGLAEGQTAIAQFMGVRLKAFIGEWDYNTSYGGVDRDRQLVKSPDLSVVGAIRKAAILEVPGVTRIRRYEATFDRETRRYSEEIEVDTVFGSVSV